MGIARIANNNNKNNNTVSSNSSIVVPKYYSSDEKFMSYFFFVVIDVMVGLGKKKHMNCNASTNCASTTIYWAT